MQKSFFALILLLAAAMQTKAQSSFDWQVSITPLSIPNMPALQSFAKAQHNGKWLLIGGRKDGLHARQPFSAFPAVQNNATVYVVDPVSAQVWSAPLSGLPTGITEQLQSTNMNFYQDHDTLYIIGGYAFSATANDHITFDKLSSIDIPGLMNAVQTNAPVASFFKQISDTLFANTGGQLGKIGNDFVLVGGQRFDGRYNPMNNPTYTQTYHTRITRFRINNSGNQLSISNVQTVYDAVHLRRRDYNLLPQVFPDGSEGYTISAGVFQANADLPFLYPVDITATGYIPRTGFNQYLSHYHSARACLWDSTANRMHNLFFGGMSQYFMQNGVLTQDVNVPFVKTISRMSRMADSTLQEVQLNTDMPALLGAGAEFFLASGVPHNEHEVIKLHSVSGDTVLIGYIAGGLLSPSANPFAGNQSNTTSANATVYKVQLIRNHNVPGQVVESRNPFRFTLYPNPANREVRLRFSLNNATTIRYMLTALDGRMLAEGDLYGAHSGDNDIALPLPDAARGQVRLTLVSEGIYFHTETFYVQH
jgi:hypothetical protein